MSVIKGLAIATLTSLAAATVLLLLQVTPSVSQEEYNPDAPQARATERALRRAERRSMRLSPEARETARAARREEERQRWQEARPVEVRDPPCRYPSNCETPARSWPQEGL